MADYLTRPELEAVKKSRGLQSIERDVNYGLEWDTDESDNGNVSEKENQETPTLRKTSSIEGLQLSVCIVEWWLELNITYPHRVVLKLTRSFISYIASTDVRSPSSLGTNKITFPAPAYHSTDLIRISSRQIRAYKRFHDIGWSI